LNESQTISGQGSITSTGGIISLQEGGRLLGNGILDVSGSIWTLGDNFTKTSGTLTMLQTTLKLEDNSTLTSNEALNFVNLNLNDYALTLGSSTSDLTVQNTITIDSSGEGLLTGEADLILLSSLNMSQGLLGSTGGTWVLIKDFLKSGGTLTISQTDLELKDSIKLTSDQALSFVFVTLNLNNFTLTLGSSTSDLTVENAITIDASTEGILTGEADLILLSSLNMSQGLLGSTGGTWVLIKDFLKSGGTLTISQTDLELKDSIKLTSDEALSFVTLNLNDFTLTLGSSTSDLTVQNDITIDTSTEGISTGEADLILNSALTMSYGLLDSTGGTWVLGGDFVKSSGTLTTSQTNLELAGSSITLTSDEGLSFVNLNLNDYALTLGSSTSDLTVQNAITIDASTEGIFTGEADLILNRALTMSNGRLESTGGTIKLAHGQIQTSKFSGDARMMLDNTTLTSDDGSLIAFIEIDGEPDLSMTDSSYISNITLSITSGTAGTISTAGGVNCLVNCTGFIETGAYGFNTHGLYRKVTSANWMLTESSGERKTAIIAVKLLSRPLSDVEVILGSSDLTEAILDKYLLTFTPSTWNRIQEVTITGEDDDVSDYDVRVRILGYTDSLASIEGEPVPEDEIVSVADSGGDLQITSTNHNLDEDDIIRFTTTDTLPTGLALSTDYYVVGTPATNTFFVSTSEGGNEVTYTNAGTGTHSWHCRRHQPLRSSKHNSSCKRIDTNYASTSAIKTHAFKYTFTNINDDLQKGVSPIVQIGPDQKVNAKTRVILDGSASYDPDPTGRIISFKWKYVGQLPNYSTLPRESESIAYFTAPDISETTVMLFGLEVIDDDKTASYGSTSITIEPVQGVDAVVSGGIEPKYPDDITLDSEETASDGSKNLQLISGTSTFTTTLGVAMNLDGTASSSVKTVDNSSGEEIITSTKVNLPLGIDLNMNKDASLSISKELDGNVFLTTNISADGAVTVGVVSTNGIGPNLKAPKGSEVTIATDGTSSISMPASTDSTSGITTQVVSTLSPDGSTQIEMSFSGGSGRTANADGSSGSKSTLSTDSGLAVAIDTSSGVTASMVVPEGKLKASLKSDGTSDTSFDNGTSETTFSSSISMNLQVKSGKVVSTSSAETGNDGVSRTITSTTNSTNTTIQAQGTSVSDSTLEAATGSTISLSKNRTVTSTFAPSTSMTSSVTLNSEGLMIPTITTVSSNVKQVFPEVGAGGTVSQESGKLVVTIPLTTSGSSRNSSKRSSSLRTSQRGGVSSEYATTGQWVGVDSTSGKPIYVQSASTGATLVLENAYDNTTTVSLSAGTADLRIGDALPTALSSTVSVKSTPASVTMSGSRNLVSLPAYTSITPASFESQFSSYKAVWARRSGAWQFYTSSDNKTVYTDKGYTELTSSIEAGEGFWVELNAPVNPVNLEVANYGGYTSLPQLSSMTSEWNIAGTSKKITVEEITQAANFDQTSEDESNTLGFIENSGGNGPPSGLQISNFEFEIAVNEFGQSSRIALLMAVLLLASASLMLYRRQTQLRNNSQSQNSHLRIPAWQLFSVAGIIMFVVACAPPQGDSTSSTFDYSGSYDRVHSVWKWDDENSKWLAYSSKTSIAQELSTEGYSTFSFVEKGQGYWVRISASGVPTSLSFAEPPAF